MDQCRRMDHSLGSFVHFELWHEMAAAVSADDINYIFEFYEGLPVIGDILRSGVWRDDPHPAALSEADLLHRAWDIRKSVNHKVLKGGVTSNTQQLWDDTLKDLKRGYCLGPFKEDQVDIELGTDRWIPTPRFPVEQKDKVRGVDSATESMINGATGISEKLQISSTDLNAAIIRLFHRMGKSNQFLGVVSKANPTPTTFTRCAGMPRSSARLATRPCGPLL